MNTHGKDVGPASMLFEMTRDDNPRLYDDLMRFNKGTKRINRLRFLAHEGLLAQSWVLVPAAARQAGPAAAGVSSDGFDLGDPSLTNQAFAQPLPE